ncbi:hypothetical protein KBZ09_06855 [Cyanobium sp. Cruz CV11-17]|nr:hypothetical protein [Cyanobium sp. Cruz CV11-17]
MGHLFNWHGITSAFGGGSRFAANVLLPVAPVQSSIKELQTSVVPKSSQLAEIHSRPHHLKKFVGHAAFGAALLVTGLQAGAASALSFNFSFTGTGNPTSPATVTGIVDGLVDNQANQKTGLTFTITSATNTPTLGWSVFSTYDGETGIDVSGGQVTGADVIYVNTSDGTQTLYLGAFGFLAEINTFSSNDKKYFSISDSSSSLVFTPASPASVPGPLPLFGAGAAFGWSRRLRRRIKSPA